MVRVLHARRRSGPHQRASMRSADLVAEDSKALNGWCKSPCRHRSGSYIVGVWLLTVPGRVNGVAGQPPTHLMSCRFCLWLIALLRRTWVDPRNICQERRSEMDHRTLSCWLSAAVLLESFPFGREQHSLGERQSLHVARLLSSVSMVA